MRVTFGKFAIDACESTVAMVKRLQVKKIFGKKKLKNQNQNSLKKLVEKICQTQLKPCKKPKKNRWRINGEKGQKGQKNQNTNLGSLNLRSSAKRTARLRIAIKQNSTNTNFRLKWVKSIIIFFLFSLLINFQVFLWTVDYCRLTAL